MAKATATHIDRTITLELNEREAEFIYFVVGSCVVGDAEGGPREHSNAIYYAMSQLDLNTRAVRLAKVHSSPGQLQFRRFSEQPKASGGVL